MSWHLRKIQEVLPICMECGGGEIELHGRTSGTRKPPGGERSPDPSLYGQLDLESGDWTYCNAGHEPPVLVRRDGTTARLSTGGPVLGVLPRIVYRQESLRLSRGDRIVMFTDGVTEATDRTGQELGLHRLLQIVERNREESPERIVKRLFEVTESFCHGPFPDDVTLLTVAYDGLRASNRIELFLREHPARLSTPFEPPPTRRAS